MKRSAAALTSILVSVLVLGFAGRARAQTYQPELEVDPFVFTSDPHAVGLTESAAPMKSGEVAVGLDLRVGGPPLEVCTQDASGTCTKQGNLVGTRVATDVTAAIGFGRLGAHLQLPVILHQSSDFDPAMGQSRLSAAGIGDLRLGGKVRLVEAGGAALGFDLTASLPTARGADFIGNGGLMIEGAAIGEWTHGALALDGHFGYAWRQHASQLLNLYVNDELLWSAAGSYGFGKATAGLAVFGRIGVVADPSDPMPNLSSDERPVEALASLAYRVAPAWTVDVGAGAGLTKGYGAPPFRVLAGVRWMHEKPARKEPPPPPPPPPAPKDTDKDGITDDVDKCPTDPEDKDGFQDDDGCPDPDNDGDGINDKIDQCPNDAEDKDGFEDDDGCPDPDNDKDGIPDATDKCPNDPETVNGFEDDDGCPDVKPQVQVTTSSFEINDRIYFDLNKARIKHKSYALLDAVAKAILANPDVRVEVQGHTDDTGSEDWNQKLSDLRAKAVRDYLVKKGVPKAQVEAKGYGNTVPRVQGTDEASRSQNRRVEFVIIK